MNEVCGHKEPQATLPPRRLHALIIDNDDQIQRLLSRIFGQCQYRVDIARTCCEAREKAESRTYDLALVDVNLSDGNGLDLIEPLRQFSPNIEIISMTGDNPRSVEAKARECKVAYHLIKPLDFQELISVLTHMARRVQSLYASSFETLEGGTHV